MKGEEEKDGRSVGKTKKEEKERKGGKKGMRAVEDNWQ